MRWILQKVALLHILPGWFVELFSHFFPSRLYLLAQFVNAPASIVALGWGRNRTTAPHQPGCTQWVGICVTASMKDFKSVPWPDWTTRNFHCASDQPTQALWRGQRERRVKLENASTRLNWTLMRCTSGWPCHNSTKQGSRESQRDEGDRVQQEKTGDGGRAYAESNRMI